jgi:hypothetical protein
MSFKDIDKQIHFFSGLALCLAVALFFGAYAGLAVAVLAGLGKEVYDNYGRGAPDIYDAVATAVGGALGFVLIMIAEAL